LRSPPLPVQEQAPVAGTGKRVRVVAAGNHARTARRHRLVARAHARRAVTVSGSRRRTAVGAVERGSGWVRRARRRWRGRSAAVPRAKLVATRGLRRGGRRRRDRCRRRRRRGAGRAGAHLDCFLASARTRARGRDQQERSAPRSSSRTSHRPSMTLGARRRFRRVPAWTRST
jgi:hypothetical protein